MNAAAAWTDPKDALVNPRGRKVCLDQCGTVGLVCPEAFVGLSRSCSSPAFLFVSEEAEKANRKERGALLLEHPQFLPSFALNKQCGEIRETRLTAKRSGLSKVITASDAVRRGGRR